MDQNLTWGLALLGAVVLMAVVAHGAWAARKADPKRATEWYKPEPPMNDPTAASDAVVHEEKAASPSAATQTAVSAELQRPDAEQDPLMASSTADAQSSTRAALDIDLDPATTTMPGVFTSLDEAAPTTHVAKPASDDPQHPAKKATPRLDALIDALTNLTLDKPMSGDALLAHLGAAGGRIGSKPFLIEGLNATRGEWEPLEPGQLYSELQAGVQLANRRGAINDIEYSEFVQKIQTFAEAVNTSPVNCPDMLDVVARARELDTFAAEHDAHLAVRLQSRGTAWSVSYVQQHAIGLGFALGSVAGRMVWPAPAAGGAPPVFILSLDAQAALADDPNQSAVREVTLGFDVPQTAEQAEPRPFTSWKTLAHTLAEKLEAQLSDDQGQPLGEEGFASIDEALKHLYTQLASRDLAAGSVAARRLFS
jgi:hypothetical protein